MEGYDAVHLGFLKVPDGSLKLRLQPGNRDGTHLQAAFSKGRGDLLSEAVDSRTHFRPHVIVELDIQRQESHFRFARHIPPCISKKDSVIPASQSISALLR